LPELTIAFAKGRLQDEALELFARAGIRPAERVNSRCLAINDEAGEVRFIFVKPADVPVYVEHGIADGGVVGRDVLLESEADVLQPLNLEIGKCKIAVAALNGFGVPPSGGFFLNGIPPKGGTPNRSTHLRVATKYPRIAAQFFGSKGQPVEIIQLTGSVELAPALGLADCIVDLVETGRTLRENGLSLVEIIAESTAQLVVNRASYQLKAKTIGKLIGMLKNSAGWKDPTPSARSAQQHKAWGGAKRNPRTKGA
jgi:ATP phosphoribosyltransferase